MGIVYYSCFIEFISKPYSAAGRRVKWGRERLQNSSTVKPVLYLVAGLPEIPPLAEMFSIVFYGETVHFEILLKLFILPSQLVEFIGEW